MPPTFSWPATAPAEPPAPRPGVSVQNLLLGLGTALVVVAGIVFTAVSWSRLGATFQGLILVALTALAGVATAACAHRRLPATAEALGIVAVMGALADAHALRIASLPHLDPRAYWAGAFGAVALAATALGRGTGVRSTRVAAAVLAQLPLFALLDRWQASVSTVAFAILAQVAVVLVVVARPTGVRLARQVAAAIAVGTWGWAVFGSLAWMFVAEPGERRVLAAAVAVGGLVAFLAAWLRADDERIRPVAMLAASALPLVAATVALATVWSVGLALVGGGMVGAVALAAALRVPARWGNEAAVVSGAAAAVPLVLLAAAAAGVLATAGDVLGRAWTLDAGARASHLVQRHGTVGPRMLLLELVAAAIVVVAVAPKVSRRSIGLGAAAILGVAVVVAPLLLPLSIGTTAVVALVAAALLVLVASLPGAPAAAIHGGRLASPSSRVRLEVGAIVALPLLVLGLAWASAARPTTLVGLAVTLALAGVLAAAGRARGAEGVGVSAAVGVVLAAGALAGLGFLVDDVAAGPAWASAAAAAGLVGLVGGLLLDPEGRGQGLEARIGWALEITAWTVHATALVAVCAIGDPVGLQAALTVGAVVGALHAVRPGRLPLAGVAAAHALALSWFVLARAEVQAPEPYAAPLAAALLLAGLVAHRRARRQGDELASWIWLGPALLVAAVPSGLVALGDPGMVRPLVLLASGAAVLAVGALVGKRAPVDVGLAVVAVIGLRQLAPVVGSMPNWATLGSTGLLLLAVGATFEQRRRDLTGVRHRYGSLT